MNKISMGNKGRIRTLCHVVSQCASPCGRSWPLRGKQPFGPWLRPPFGVPLFAADVMPLTIKG